MASSVQELQPKPGESEKITINLSYVDLGHVDLMVQQGFYSNRTDFIRTAIRNQLSLSLNVLGLVSIAGDVTAEAALADRMR